MKEVQAGRPYSLHMSSAAIHGFRCDREHEIFLEGDIT